MLTDKAGVRDSGDLHIQVIAIDNDADVTTAVDYHPTHDGSGIPAWTALPAYGTNIPGLTFDGRDAYHTMKQVLDSQQD
ncbi:MAG: hypothetical protein R2883_01830 [Caldisericia bacterium]